MKREDCMTNFILELSVSIKTLFREKINIVIILLIAIFSFNIFAYNQIKKKIDHRYFNTTTSLEEIHNIKINTLNVELKYKHIN